MKSVGIFEGSRNLPNELVGTPALWRCPGSWLRPEPLGGVSANSGNDPSCMSQVRSRAGPRSLEPAVSRVSAPL